MRYLLLMMLATVLVCGGCGDDSDDGGGDIDTDTDTDGDTDTDTDTGTEYEYQGILCGYSICYAPQECCVFGSPVSQDCTDPGECAGDLVVTCDGPEDCPPDNECCLPSGASHSTACAPGECMDDHAMCHDNEDCDSLEFCYTGMFLGYTISICSSASGSPGRQGR